MAQDHCIFLLFLRVTYFISEKLQLILYNSRKDNIICFCCILLLNTPTTHSFEFCLPGIILVPEEVAVNPTDQSPGQRVTHTILCARRDEGEDIKVNNNSSLV